MLEELEKEAETLVMQNKPREEIITTLMNKGYRKETVEKIVANYCALKNFGFTV